MRVIGSSAKASSVRADELFSSRARGLNKRDLDQGCAAGPVAVAVASSLSERDRCIYESARATEDIDQFGGILGRSTLLIVVEVYKREMAAPLHAQQPLRPFNQALC